MTLTPPFRPAALFAAGLLSAAPAAAGISFTAADPAVTIDFEAGSAGVNGSTPFEAGGFSYPGDRAGTPEGTLDSTVWAVSGLSGQNQPTGSTFFTGIEGTGRAIGGDFGRGTSTAGVSEGGVYAFKFAANNSAPNDSGTFLGAQPTVPDTNTGGDFESGAFFLRILNESGGVLDAVTVAYDLLVRNDQDGSGLLTFGFGTAGNVADPADRNAVDFKNVDALNVTTTAAAGSGSTGTGNDAPFLTTARGTTLTGLNLKNDEYLYLRFGHAGNHKENPGVLYDEWGIDNLTLAANVQAVPELGSTLLFTLAGLGGVVGVRRRRAAA